MILSFLNQKGGTGKTTLALGAAAYWARQGRTVLFVDADPQGTASRWAGLRQDAAFPVVQMARDNIATEILRMAQDYADVVIDGPARGEVLSRAVIAASDLVVVPVEASAASSWSAEVTARQIEEARQFKPALQSVYLMSRMHPRTVLGTAMRSNMTAAGIELLEAVICNRVAFAEALSQGLTIYEWAPASPATAEVDAVMDEIDQLTGVDHG